MKLRDWLRAMGKTQARYGDEIDKSQQAVARYCNGRIPSRPVMVRIYRDSRGLVTPNDFYDLPPLEPVNDNRATEHAPGDPAVPGVRA
ncbi:MAG: XRE family transcriptional regulator [Rhodospirillaceae bacterium]|nr:MAG: XRE family transcriptional regulator [Rhodospirillaceae bacterium]